MPLHESKKATLADWEALGEDVRAELFDGEIYNMAGPSAAHQRILSFLHIEIGTYLRGKTCEVFTAPFDVYLQHEDEDTPNIVQPDLIEIVSPSTSRRDYLTKLNLYAEYGVKEYWIVNPDREAVTVYQLDNDLLPAAYTFRDTIKVYTLADLSIDFTQLDLE